MPIRKAPPSPIKASETVVSRMLAKMLGVPAFENLQEVCDAFCESGPTDAMLSVMISRVHGVYPWMSDVATEVMSTGSTPLAEHLLSMPGTLYVAKDSIRAGPDSIWLVVADPPQEITFAIQRMECRGLFHTFKIGNVRSMLLAVQLASCKP